MTRNLPDLEKTSRMLEASLAEREAWTDEVCAYGNNFIEQIDKGPVYTHSEDELAPLIALDFQENKRSLTELMDLIGTTIDGTGINPASPRHLGYVPGGGVYPSALGDYLAGVSNRYAGIFYANPGAVYLEDKCVRWMAKLIGYPENSAGHLSSGGSIATLTAITAARDHHQIVPENVRNQVIYLTRQAHHCILKALRLTALDYAQIRFIPTNDLYQMEINALRDQINADRNNGLQPFLIVGSAGSTDTGAIDPFDEMAEVAQLHGCWFHIDAAYGGFFMLVEKMRQKFQGIDRSDSIVLDPHKGLFLAYGTGAVVIKDRQAALKTHYYQANYMQDAYGDYSVLNPADISPELTKHFRGMRMWLSLQLFGIAPFRAALEEKLILAQYFHEEVQKIGFSVGPTPSLSVCLFRLELEDLTHSNKANKELMDKILTSGKIFLSSTTINEIFWLRICIMVFRTHKEHIDLFLALLTEITTLTKEK